VSAASWQASQGPPSCAQGRRLHSACLHVNSCRANVYITQLIIRKKTPLLQGHRGQCDCGKVAVNRLPARCMQCPTAHLAAGWTLRPPPPRDTRCARSPLHL
jgi:hypothetical protein